jgi:type I restriction enzyme S subunit
MTVWLSGALEDLCEIEYGTRVTRKRDGGTKFPVYGGGGATFYLDDFNREDQMIVSRFAMSEECVRFVPGKFFLNDSGLTVRPRDEAKMSQEFLDQQLLAKSSEIYSTARGAAQKNMDMTMFRSMELSFPDSLSEQKRIVALLDAATACVTELTECYEQARTHANNLFSSALGEALVGNPDWPVQTLGEVCEVFDDGDWIESKDQAVSGVRLIQTGNVGDGEFKDRADKARFVSESTFSRLRCTEIFPGDVLVSRLPDPVGRACLIPVTGFKMITAVDCTIMRPRSEVMLSRFLVLATQTSAYREQVRAKITGASRDRISRSNLAEVQVLVPPLEEQKQIVARMDSMRAKTSEMVAAYDAKLVSAKNLRQSVLEAAFAGEL